MSEPIAGSSARPADNSVELFSGRLWDGCPISIVKSGDLVRVHLAFFSFALDSDLWFDFSNIAAMVADKIDALETGDVDALREVQRSINERNAECNNGFCDECGGDIHDDVPPTP